MRLLTTLAPAVSAVFVDEVLDGSATVPGAGGGGYVVVGLRIIRKTNSNPPPTNSIVSVSVAPIFLRAMCASFLR